MFSSHPHFLSLSLSLSFSLSLFLNPRPLLLSSSLLKTHHFFSKIASTKILPKTTNPTQSKELLFALGCGGLDQQSQELSQCHVSKLAKKLRVKEEEIKLKHVIAFDCGKIKHLVATAISLASPVEQSKVATMLYYTS
ncbi:hypothetical protein CFP56_038733 [Quercus suber]|uniref:Uncharacterized protein n=1 Tax=Quercus suber TaxID=58331 RepID=A0AAW0J1X9_QUESU